MSKKACMESPFQKIKKKEKKGTVPLLVEEENRHYKEDAAKMCLWSPHRPTFLSRHSQPWLGAQMFLFPRALLPSSFTLAVP